MVSGQRRAGGAHVHLAGQVWAQPGGVPQWGGTHRVRGVSQQRALRPQLSCTTLETQWAPTSVLCLRPFGRLCAYWDLGMAESSHSGHSAEEVVGSGPLRTRVSGEGGVDAGWSGSISSPSSWWVVSTHVQPKTRDGRWALGGHGNQEQAWLTQQEGGAGWGRSVWHTCMLMNSVPLLVASLRVFPHRTDEHRGAGR